MIYCRTPVFSKKGCTRFTAASDKVCQLLAHGRWFSPGTSASSTSKTGRHDIAEILLKGVKTPKINSHNSKIFQVYSGRHYIGEVNRVHPFL
jgi:hypothetical protein